MKIMRYFLGILLGILIILLNFRLIVFNYGFYEKENTNNIFAKDNSNEIKNLIRFLEEKKEINKSFFNEKEELHLYDVRNLIQKTIYIFYLSFFIFILFIIKYYKDIFNITLISGIFLILTIIILFFLSFNNLFYNFHLIFFNNDLWMLDPSKDNLINLFPESFFYNVFYRIIYNSFFTWTILFLISILHFKVVKHKK